MRLKFQQVSLHTQIHPTLIIMKYLVAISILFAASTAIAVDIDPRISHIADRLSSTDAYTDSARNRRGL